MKNLIFILLTVLLFSCEQKEYKYKIEGYVMVNKPKSYTYIPNEDTTKYLHEAIAITDTIYGLNKDSIWYYNTNGSKMTILAPYKIDTLK
jgi:hypothetical protein